MAVKLYEGMFVVDAAKGGAEFAATVRLVAGMLQRHGAQIERIEKWAERKFAYPIGQSKRGVYILVYFKAEGTAVQAVREDVALSEDILRVLVLAPHAVAPATGDIYNAEGEMVEEARTTTTESAFAGTSTSGTTGTPQEPAKAQAEEDEDDDGDGDEDEDE